MFITQVNKYFTPHIKAGATATTLWQVLVRAEPGFGPRCSADAFGATTQLLTLMARIAPQYKRSAAAGPADGKGKGKGKGAGFVPNPTPAHANASRSTSKGNG